MIGQTQHLEANKRGLHYKSRGLDLSPLLTPASELNPSAGIINRTTQDHGLLKKKDVDFIKKAAQALESKIPIVLKPRPTISIARLERCSHTKSRSDTVLKDSRTIPSI